MIGLMQALQLGLNPVSDCFLVSVTTNNNALRGEDHEHLNPKLGEVGDFVGRIAGSYLDGIDFLVKEQLMELYAEN